MVDLNIKITKSDKSIKDIISDALECIQEDRHDIKRTRIRVTNSILNGIDDSNGEEEVTPNLLANTAIIGSIENRLLELQSNSSKNMIELLKVVAKISEPTENDRAVGNGDDIHDLIEIYDKLNTTDNEIDAIINNLNAEEAKFKADAFQHQPVT